MGRSPLLESFDLAGPLFGPAIASAPSPDWRDGHAQGFAEGRAQAGIEHGALSVEMAQTLSDMAFGYAEARAHVLTALGPLFTALIDHVLPGVTEAAHASDLVSLLNAAAEQDSAAPLELTVHPTRSAGLASLLPYAVGLPILMISDPTVGPDQAILRTGRGETMLDTGAVIIGAKAALTAIFETAEQRVSYG